MVGKAVAFDHKRELVSNHLTVSFGAFIFELTEHPRRDRNVYQQTLQPLSGGTTESTTWGLEGSFGTWQRTD